MNKYQEALNELIEATNVCIGDRVTTEYQEEKAILQELIDLHEPKEIKAGQVWECVKMNTVAGTYGADVVSYGIKIEERVKIGESWETEVLLIDDLDIEYSYRTYKGWTAFVYKGQFQACFKLVKDVE